MLTVLSFLLALALLIAIHEYGHYRIARACGVKVLRFSLGFGKVLVRWQPKPGGTEFVLCALPLGGYVRMLDERESPVPQSDRHLAFNTQPLGSRVAIVAAGPLANLVLAILLFACVNWLGSTAAAPVLSTPISDSAAQRSGLVAGAVVLEAAIGTAQLHRIDSFEDVRWLLTNAALDGQDARLLVINEPGRAPTEHVLALAKLDTRVVDAALLRQIGIVAPLSAAVLGELVPGAAAQRSGLHAGDVVKEVGGIRVNDSAQLRELIRNTLPSDSVPALPWVIQRGDRLLDVWVTPNVVVEAETRVGKIGALIGSPPRQITVQLGFVAGLRAGAVRTWDMSWLTLKMLGKMLTGQSSVKNLSGPLTIADFAGKSASLGWVPYLTFLAVISVSLGVLNLLPLPILDGGHLMYYLYENISGKAVSEFWLERLQQGGIGMLLILMSIALFNDLTRFFG